MWLWGTLRLVVTVVKSARCWLSATVSSILTSWNRYVIIVTWPSRSSTFTIISLWNWSSRIIAGYFVCDAEPSLSSRLGCIVLFFYSTPNFHFPVCGRLPLSFESLTTKVKPQRSFNSPNFGLDLSVKERKGGGNKSREMHRRRFDFAEELKKSNSC